MSGAPPALPVPVAELTGPIIVGLCLSWGLFGCATVQVYNYHYFFPKDRRALKALVFSLYLWEFAQTVLFTQAYFKIFGPGFGNIAVLESVGTVWFSNPIMGSISSATVQCFYAWRVYQFGRSVFPTILIVLLALMESSAAIAGGLIVGIGHGTFAQVESQTYPATVVWLLGDLICDAVICASMLYFLHTAKSKTTIVQTGDMLTRIIRIVVGTGVATTLITLVNVTFWFTVTNNDNIDLAPSMILGKLYVNAFLVTLTSRQSLRSRDGLVTEYVWDGAGTTRGGQGVSGVESGIQFSDGPLVSRNGPGVTRMGRPVEVNVERSMQMVSFGVPEPGNVGDRKFGGETFA